MRGSEKIEYGTKRDISYTISEMLPRLPEGGVFSKMDGNSGLWQEQIEGGIRQLATLPTP